LNGRLRLNDRLRLIYVYTTININIDLIAMYIIERRMRGVDECGYSPGSLLARGSHKINEPPTFFWHNTLAKVVLL